MEINIQPVIGGLPCGLVLSLAGTLIERLFNKIKHIGVSRPDPTSWRPTIWPPSNPHQSAVQTEPAPDFYEAAAPTAFCRAGGVQRKRGTERSSVLSVSRRFEKGGIQFGKSETTVLLLAVRLM